MIAYAVAAAKNSKLFEKIIVSTDDRLTGRIGEWYGAEYLVRPAELATDEAGLVDVALHALESLEFRGIKVDALCQLMPNCPLRLSKDIIEHYNLFKSGPRFFQISVVPYRGVYPHWALMADDEGKGHWLFGSKHLVPSQQLDVAYCPTGAIWWVRTAKFVTQRKFYGNPFYLALMDANRGVDIDRLEELEFADILVRGLWQRNGVSPLEPVHMESFPQKELNG